MADDSSSFRLDPDAPVDGDPAETPVAADGRVPGPRGRETREKLLATTAAMLATTPYRDLKVVDIAREVGSSPASFYQYFPDVEAAIAVIAERTAVDAERLLVALRDASWMGRAAWATAMDIAGAFLDFWIEHEAVLRVLDLSIAEGSAEHRAIRNRMLGPVTEHLRDAFAEMQARGRHDPSLQPEAQAAVLVSMLAHVAEHRTGLVGWGVPRENLQSSMARVVHWSITGRKQPE